MATSSARLCEPTKPVIPVTKMRNGRKPHSTAKCQQHQGQWAWRTGVAKASRVRTRYAHPTYEPNHYDDNQNEAQNAAEPSSSVTTMRILPTAAAENKNQNNNDKNGAHA